jgi:NodT family efflux transporter outer membrane factor (OMF) lipoprotein
MLKLRLFPRARLAATPILILVLTLGGCAATGPDFVKPTPPAPDDWSSWRSGDLSLRAPVGATPTLPDRWWEAFGDPVLNELQRQAVLGSPDLQTAAVRFMQARVQRDTQAAQEMPDIGFNAQATRLRTSDWGAGTRLIDILGLPREQLVPLLVGPYSLYQAGFDMSWELDFWGRVRRSVEAADADMAHQAALLDLARLGLASEVARHYLDLRTTQRQIRLAKEDEAMLQERLDLLDAQVRGGLINHLNLERQRTELAAVKAQIPPLLAQEATSANQIALLVGKHPGELRDMLGAGEPQSPKALPDLSMGLPSELALRRPDIRSAEARLHQATAQIGVAQADLYPSIRINASFGLESYLGSEFANWGSRSWSVGPVLDLPLFDGGRRKSVVHLRELQQQEAAIDYHRTVLQAWQEIDDALNGYVSERQQGEALSARVESARDAYQLAQARYDGGIEDFTTVLDAQRVFLQTRRDLVASEGRLGVRYVTLNKALGNGPAQEAQDVAATQGQGH